MTVRELIRALEAPDDADANVRGRMRLKRVCIRGDNSDLDMVEIEGASYDAESDCVILETGD